jgi:hypothetical protein
MNKEKRNKRLQQNIVRIYIAPYRTQQQVGQVEMLRNNYISFDTNQTKSRIALGYRLYDRGSRVRFPAEAGNFSLHHCVQNGTGAHPVSYPKGTGGSFLGDEAARA